MSSTMRSAQHHPAHFPLCKKSQVMWILLMPSLNASHIRPRRLSLSKKPREGSMLLLSGVPNAPAASQHPYAIVSSTRYGTWVFFLMNFHFPFHNQVRLKSAPENIIKTIMGHQTINPNIPALKYGRSTEGEAAEVYLTHCHKQHHNLCTAECGLFVSAEHGFMAATPDRLISCDCCGEGVLENQMPLLCR